MPFAAYKFVMVRGAERVSMRPMKQADDHPQRFDLVNELHARPPARITPPCTVAYLAFKPLGAAALRDLAEDMRHLADLAGRYGGPQPDPGQSHYSGQLGRYQLRWERHTEFVTYAALLPGLARPAFDPHIGAVFDDDWQQQAPGKRLAAVMVHIETLPDDLVDLTRRVHDWFVPDSLAMAWAMDESALVATDFRVDASGWMRFAVFVRTGTGPGRVGRLVQSLLEVETYRAMSMLALERCRLLNDRLNELQPQLNALTDGIAGAGARSEQVLNDLLAVSAQLRSLAAQHSFRFGATAAYQAIVEDRLAALRETRFKGRQMLNEFLERRYLPAMRTVRSAEARLREMQARAARAAELLRTSVDVRRQAQNQALLESMDRRADLQLRLQHTVEGLSVVAISYYAMGLLGYVLTPVAHALSMDKGWLTAFLVPVVALSVWGGMRHIRARLERRPGDH